MSSVFSSSRLKVTPSTFFFFSLFFFFLQKKMLHRKNEMPSTQMCPSHVVLHSVLSCHISLSVLQELLSDHSSVVKLFGICVC